MMLILFFGMKMSGQEFSVRSFRLLPNDITAYINPVKDLNKEACALIKVVGSADFVFSTPLGIVQRKEEVGEIWIYVPNGTIQITIKHPEWGVLRDYYLDSPLESRMTYELVLLPPPDFFRPKRMVGLQRKPVKLWENGKNFSVSLNDAPSSQDWVYAPWSYFVMANVGLAKAAPLWGIRVGMIKRHGFYLSCNWKSFSVPKTEGRCDKWGFVEEKNGVPYYSGKTQTGNWKVLAGGIHRLIGKLCLWEGVGYGEQTVAWETSAGNWLYNSGYSTKGLSAEAGLFYHIHSLALSAGVTTIKGKYWEATLGLGVFLK